MKDSQADNIIQFVLDVTKAKVVLSLQDVVEEENAITINREPNSEFISFCPKQKVFSYHRRNHCWLHNGLWFINYKTMKNYWEKENSCWLTSVMLSCELYDCKYPCVIMVTDSNEEECLAFNMLKDVK